jgi:hypothetical protein
MEAQKLITSENKLAVGQVLAIAKQDIAIEDAIKSLNELCHINRIEFTAYGQQYGFTNELLQEVRNLQYKLLNAKYGGF